MLRVAACILFHAQPLHHNSVLVRKMQKSSSTETGTNYPSQDFPAVHGGVAGGSATDGGDLRLAEAPPPADWLPVLAVDCPMFSVGLSSPRILVALPIQHDQCAADTNKTTNTIGSSMAGTSWISLSPAFLVAVLRMPEASGLF